LNLKAKVKKFWNRAKYKILAAAASAAGIVTPAAAQTNGTTSVNWTQLGDMIRGAADLMPGISDLVVSIVPVLLILIVVGFVVGLFDSIIAAIRDAFRFLR